MTKGALLPLILTYTFPLILGSILQLTYNAADSIIVGKYVGKEALAAVGTGNPTMSLLLMFFQGISIGTGVLVGQFYGGKKYDQLQRQISTAAISGSVLAAVLSLGVCALASDILRILKADPVILPLAALYLRIIAAGLIFSFLYNFFSGTLSAMGDSKSPLLFLAISSLINIAGDLFLVIVLRLGVLGCAVSTVGSEALSCLFCYLYIVRKVPLLNMGRKWLTFDLEMLKKTLEYGLVSGIQQCSVQLGIVSVQGMVNSLGVVTTAAYAAANRVDDYALIIERNIANATTAVIAQNMGGGNRGRVWKTFRIGILLNVCYSILAGVILLLFSEHLMRLFTNDPGVIREGFSYLNLIAWMYILPSATSVMQGMFRGIGKIYLTMLGTILNMGVRVLVCFVLYRKGDFLITSVPWASLAGWSVMSVLQIALLVVMWRQRHD